MVFERAFPTSIDIFCAVVDNFGDIGVCLRLSRVLAGEGLRVRLYVDDMAVAARLIQGEVTPNLTIIPWEANLSYQDCADLVIEAFACNLPAQVLDVMKARETPTVWVDLEYLSAEDWVAGCHAIPSRHPATGLMKTLFFPGFDTRTGGLIYESDLRRARDHFSPEDWRHEKGLPAPASDTLDFSLFCYRTAPEDDLYSGLIAQPHPVRVIRPGRATGKTPEIVAEQGSLTLINAPFYTQEDYDRLLWSMDLNFVRGEDSFVRAQFSAKPLIWNIYYQEEGAHFVKMDAFLRLYGGSFSSSDAESLADFHDLWNERGHKNPDSWQNLPKTLERFSDGARNWADRLMTQPSLADRLLDFACQHNRTMKQKL